MVRILQNRQPFDYPNEPVNGPVSDAIITVPEGITISKLEVGAWLDFSQVNRRRQIISIN